MPAKIEINGVNFTHGRLTELMKLADLARPFHRWVEQVFQQVLGNDRSLSDNLLTADAASIASAIRACYDAPAGPSKIPRLYDGIGRAYPHRKACFYFFSWVVRDAPQQRLASLVSRSLRNAGLRGSKARRLHEAEVLGALISAYRDILGSFEWPCVREIICDRLEGSRRSIRGHQKEVVVRTALATSFQEFFSDTGGYGVYEDVEIPDGELRLDNEKFDVGAKLIHRDAVHSRLVLVPVKTRETEGGGHSHIFTRDINSAIDASKQNAQNFVIVVIVAQNWSEREKAHVEEICDLAIILRMDPNEFDCFPEEAQGEMNLFIRQILEATMQPKRWEEIRGLLSEE